MKASSRISESVCTSGMVDALLDSMPTALLYVDADGVIQAASAKMEEFFDLRPDQLLNKPLEEFVEPFSRCFAEFMSYTEVIAQPLQDATQDFLKDVELAHPRERYLQVSSHPVSVNAEPAGRLWMMRDITKEREIMELKIQYGGVRSADELKSKFMTIISHQLRTPLNSLRWNAELMLSEEEGTGLSKESHEILEQMYASVMNSIAVVDDMLLAVEIERRTLKLEKSATDVGEVIRKVVSDFTKTAGMKGVTFRVEGDLDALPRLFLDREKIEVAIERVVDNAIVYSPEGNSVEIAVKPEKKGVVIDITDHGVGIPEKEKPRVFEKFYRAKEAIKLDPNASGLGLYIAKYIIEAHDGRIDFISRESRGTTFTIGLPRMSAA